MLPHEIELPKVQLELDSEAVKIDEELVRVLVARKKKKQKPRQVWCKPWLLRRPSFGQYETLMKELALADTTAFKNFLRVDMNQFTELMDRVGPRTDREAVPWPYGRGSGVAPSLLTWQ